MPSCPPSLWTKSHITGMLCYFGERDLDCLSRFSNLVWRSLFVPFSWRLWLSIARRVWFIMNRMMNLTRLENLVRLFWQWCGILKLLYGFEWKKGAYLPIQSHYSAEWSFVQLLRWNHFNRDNVRVGMTSMAKDWKGKELEWREVEEDIERIYGEISSPCRQWLFLLDSECCLLLHLCMLETPPPPELLSSPPLFSQTLAEESQAAFNCRVQRL